MDKPEMNWLSQLEAMTVRKRSSIYQDTDKAELIRLPQVEAMTGRKRSSIYEDMAAGRMPKPIKVGPRAVAWLRADIEAWLAERVAERDTAKVAA